jgi:hypothetical protein
VRIFLRRASAALVVLFAAAALLALGGGRARAEGCATTAAPTTLAAGQISFASDCFEVASGGATATIKVVLGAPAAQDARVEIWRGSQMIDGINITAGVVEAEKAIAAQPGDEIRLGLILGPGGDGLSVADPSTARIEAAGSGSGGIPSGCRMVPVSYPAPGGPTQVLECSMFLPYTTR